jgi:DNA-binding MarR family transcriptional regulator
MHAIAAYVAEHPGCNKLEAGRCGIAGPPYPGSVESLIRGGYVRTEPGRTRLSYRLYLTEAGRKLAQYEAMVDRYRDGETRPIRVDGTVMGEL